LASFREEERGEAVTQVVLGLNLRSPHADDRLLDVLAVEDVPPRNILRAGVFPLLGIQRPVAGVRAFHVDRLMVGGGQPLGLAVDGELHGSLPGQFERSPMPSEYSPHAADSESRKPCDYFSPEGGTRSPSNSAERIDERSIRDH
jgi:hypothetical protein